MGDLHAHMLFDTWFFGVEYGSTQYIHHALDHPWVEIFGAEHRRLMHDEKAIQWIGQTYGPFAEIVARGHVALDIAFSNAKRRGKLFE